MMIKKASIQLLSRKASPIINPVINKNPISQVVIVRPPLVLIEAKENPICISNLNLIEI